MEALSIPLLAATRLAHTTWILGWCAAYEAADAIEDHRLARAHHRMQRAHRCSECRRAPRHCTRPASIREAQR